MQAEPLEEFVQAAAIRATENLAVSPRRTRTAAVDAAEREIDDDERQLTELHDMWMNKEIDTAQYRKDRRTIQARINHNRRKTVVTVKSPDATGLDMISFTGSTRAGIDVARCAAPTVKRVCQELGGKSANIILEDTDFLKAVISGTAHCFQNAGQSCNAPTRMLVPHGRLDEAASIATSIAGKTNTGNPRAAETMIGPVVNRAQWVKIQGLIKSGIDEGATLAAGGPGRPAGINKGFYVRPTVFANVTNDMTIAREEIFGPVLSIIGYEDEDDVVRIANDTPYGLAGYISSGDVERARRIARRIRAGTVNVNGASLDMAAPFGGYKQSGNGREWGRFGLEEFLEVKAVTGWGE